MNSVKILNFCESGYNYKFNYCQENEQYNKKKGILRGLHYQVEPYAQAKLFRVIKGNVLSVAVDIREKSVTFGKYKAFELNEFEKKQMLIPKGFAHGYITLSEGSICIYKVDEYFNLESMRGINFSDQYLSIDWKLDKHEIITSDNDAQSLFFKDVIKYKGKYERQ